MAPIKSTKRQPKVAKKFTIKASAEVVNVLDLNQLEKYLVEHIKVEGRTGNLGDEVTVTKVNDQIVIVSYTKFSGKYVKYLVKKFLKKNSLRDWLRIVSSSQGVYEFRFFNLVLSDDESEDEEE